MSGHAYRPFSFDPLGLGLPLVACNHAAAEARPDDHAIPAEPVHRPASISLVQHVELRRTIPLAVSASQVVARATSFPRSDLRSRPPYGARNGS